MNSRARWLSLAWISLAALVVRAIRYPLVVTPSGIDFPVVGDLFYHLRRIWYSTVHFPGTLDFDRYVSFPDGAQIVWTQAYDLVLAGVARALTGGTDQAAMEAVVIWFPPILGALTAVGAAAIAGALYGNRSALFAGLLFAVLPASFLYSQLGQLDHHAAVTAATTGVLGLTLLWVSRAAPSNRAGLLLGAGFAGLVGLWPGALIDVLLLQALAAAVALFDRDLAAARARTRSLALAHAAAALLIAPFALGNEWTEYSSWSPFVLSQLQPAWFAADATMLWVAAVAFGRLRPGPSVAPRFAVVAVLGGIGFAAMAALPALREALVQASGWFTLAERFQGHVHELRPLLFPKEGFDLGPVVGDLSILAPAFPLALLAAVVGWRSRGRGAAEGVLLAWTAGFFLLALTQRRFQGTFAVGYVIVWGAVLGHWIPAFGRGRPRAAVAFALVLGVLGIGSALRHYSPDLMQVSLHAKGQDVPRTPRRAQQHMFELAARFLEQETPPTRGYLDPTQEPEYGVLCNWGIGHLLRYRAERPMVQDNFGVYGGRRTFEKAWDYYDASDEAEAVAILDDLQVRYVVSDVQGAGSKRAYPPDSMARRLAQHFGTERSLPKKQSKISALRHHRLIFHVGLSEKRTLITPRREPAVSVWERVPGAHIRGTARPGASISASLQLATSAQKFHEFRTSTRAEPDGTWTLTVPYATEGARGSVVRATGPYQLRSGIDGVSLRVPERAVRDGAVVPGPSFQHTR